MDTNVHGGPQNTRKKQNASQTSAKMLKIFVWTWYLWIVQDLIGLRLLGGFHALRGRRKKSHHDTIK